MPDDQIPVTVSLNCKKCGNLEVTFPDDPSDNAIITVVAGGGEAAQPFAVVARPAEGFSGPATNAANYFASISRAR